MGPLISPPRGLQRSLYKPDREKNKDYYGSFFYANLVRGSSQHSEFGVDLCFIFSTVGAMDKLAAPISGSTKSSLLLGTVRLSQRQEVRD